MADRIRLLTSRPSTGQNPGPPALTPASVESATETVAAGELPSLFQSEHALENVRQRIVPLAIDIYEVRFTMSQRCRDLQQRAQDLLPGSNLSQLHERGLELLVDQLERRKFAKTDNPRGRQGGRSHPRSIPAEVRRAVHARDRGQCTYVGPDGRRCESRRVEYDHIVPLARGGASTIENLRQRCRAHNQYAADLEFGREFMDARRARNAR